MFSYPTISCINGLSYSFPAVFCAVLQRLQTISEYQTYERWVWVESEHLIRHYSILRCWLFGHKAN